MYFIKLREIPKLDLIGAAEAKPLMCGPQNCPNYCKMYINSSRRVVVVNATKSLILSNLYDYFKIKKYVF